MWLCVMAVCSFSFLSSVSRVDIIGHILTEFVHLITAMFGRLFMLVYVNISHSCTFITAACGSVTRALLINTESPCPLL